MTKSVRCKEIDCSTEPRELTLECSGYCFGCAEEIACMLAGEGIDPRSAWHSCKLIDGESECYSGS